MRNNRKNLLKMSFLHSLGSAVVGVFFPFLVANSFEFSISQLLLWMASFSLMGLLIIYPLNKFLNKHCSLQKKIRIGLVFLMSFYLILAVARGSNWLIWLATVFLLVGFYTFWPNLHVLNLQSTDKHKRGDFVGNMQSLLVGANIVAPLLSGFLLDKGWDIWISLVATISFGGAIYFSQKLRFSHYKLKNFAGTWHFFTKSFLKRPIFHMSLIEGLQSGVLFMIWPIFFKSLLTGFAQMGSFVSLAALTEVFSAKISGRITDKKSAKKTLKYAAFVRFFDIGVRGLLFWFPTTFMAGFVSFFSGALGPIFNTSFYTRIIEIAEETPDQSLEFFISREWVINFSRVIIYSIAAVLTFYFGVKSFVVLIFATALSSFGLRKS